MAFEGPDIYSLAAGMYPIVADNVSTGYSHSTDVRQNNNTAPDIYTVQNIAVKPYLTGNKIIFSKAMGELGNFHNPSEEEQLIGEMSQFATIQSAMLQQEAQTAITGDIIRETAGEQAIINRSAASGSMEEHTQTDRYISTGDLVSGEYYGGQKFDLYDTQLQQYINVTINDIRDMGHGVYGALARNHLHPQIESIDAMFNEGMITEEEKYDQIVEAGVDYYKTRADTTWNPMIRHARDSSVIMMDKFAKPIDTNKSRSYQRQMQMRNTVRDFNAEALHGMRSMNREGFTGFASQGSRTMLLQHLSQPSAMFGNGALETRPIGPYTFGFFGPFRMHARGPEKYEYITEAIGGAWGQGYFATLVEGRGLADNISLSTDEAQKTFFAGVTATVAGDTLTAAVNGTTAVAIGGHTARAARLYPEINVHHANEQFSKAIHGLIERMRDVNTIPPELTEIISKNQQRFNNRYQGGKQVWAAPYIGFFGQRYTSQQI